MEIRDYIEVVDKEGNIARLSWEEARELYYELGDRFSDEYDEEDDDDDNCKICEDYECENNLNHTVSVSPNPIKTCIGTESLPNGWKYDDRNKCWFKTISDGQTSYTTTTKSNPFAPHTIYTTPTYDPNAEIHIYVNH
jgi:hypothetical protein